MVSDDSELQRDPLFKELRSVRSRALLLLPGVCIVVVFQVLAMISGSLRQLTTLPSNALSISGVCLVLSLISLVIVAGGNLKPRRAVLDDTLVRSVHILAAGLTALALGLAGMVFVAVAQATGSTSWGAIVAVVLLGACLHVWI